MIHSPQELAAVQDAAALERPLKAVEDQLVALGLALHQQNAGAVDEAAAALHQALARAVDHFGRAARSGGVPAPLRMRLAHASGQVAAQREALARATASLDRAIDVLIPRMAPANLYSAGGGNERQSLPGGGLLA
jgi:predicted negative regulator of RcsB-dependent stress response